MTNTAKHTPGPWSVERDRAKSLSLYAGTTFIGEVYHDKDEPSTEEQGNVNLIAAAPAMYLELKEGLVLLEASHHDMVDMYGIDSLQAKTVWERIESTRNTIAQAEGR